MKRHFLGIITLLFITISTRSQTKIFIEDIHFKEFLNQSYQSLMDATGDSLIIEEAAKVTDTLNCSFKNIYSFQGLEYFINLEGLNISYNQLWGFPDISALTKLKYLNCSENYNMRYGDPDISSNIMLTEF
ncbi:MAG: hypothetical protein JXB17_12855, partial [Bacteroidales bacterium]|nr:hypothetical protein [Bacteroidales bacterium]